MVVYRGNSKKTEQKIYVMRKDCCTGLNKPEEKKFEIIKMEQAKNSCGLCEGFAERQLQNKIPYAVISCEGACLRGEVSRRVANNICFSEIPEKTSRICLGGAFTKDTGQRKLVRNAERVIVLEGCGINCASRMMKGVIEDLKPEVIHVNEQYDFNTKLFGVNEASEHEFKRFANQATENIIKKINAITHPAEIS